MIGGSEASLEIAPLSSAIISRFTIPGGELTDRIFAVGALELDQVSSFIHPILGNGTFLSATAMEEDDEPYDESRDDQRGDRAGSHRCHVYHICSNLHKKSHL